MKNAQKASKIPVEPRSDLSATLQAMRMQLKMFRHRQSRYPGWSVHMGKISSSVIITEISVAGQASLLI